MIRIVLIEDESLVAKDIQSRLCRAGYDVVGIASRGKEGIAKVDELLPDVVLMDIALKGEIDGVEAAQQIIERFDIPVIYLTVHTDAATVRRATATASYGFIVKPFGELELLAAIEMAVYKHGMEVKARESDKRISEISDALDEVIYETDTNGTFTFVNASCFPMFGYTKEELEAGLTIFDIIVPDERSGAREVFKRRIDGEKIGRVEHTGLRNDGSTFPFAVSVVTIERDGAVAGTRGIILDVTELKRAEDELREREEMLRLVLDTSNDAIGLVDVDGVFLLANEALARRFGVKPAEVTGKKGFAEKPEEVAKLRRAHFARAIATKLPVHFDDEHAGRGLENIYHPIVAHDGSITRVAVFSRDVTERKHLEEEAQSAARFPSENPDPILRLSGDGSVLFINKVASTLLGAYEDTRAEPVLSQLCNAAADALKANNMSQIEVDVSGRTYEFSVVPIVEQEYVNFYGSDITRRKRAEESLRKSEHKNRQFLEVLHEGIWVIDKDSNTSYVNPRMAAMLSYTADEMIGRHLFSFMDGGEVALAQYDLERRQQGISEEHTFEFIGKEGGRIYARLETSPILNDAGEYNGAIAAVSDITKRKQLEEELAWESAINSTIARLFTPLIAPTATIEDIALAILDEAKLLTGSEHGFVSLIDPVNRDMVSFGLTQMMLSECAIPEEKRQIRFPISPDGSYPALWGYALNTKKGFYTDAPATHPVARGTPDGHTPLAQFLAAPVLIRGNAEGEIALANPGRDYTERDLQAVERLADVYALAVVRTQEEDAVKSALKERETLLKEIHHRVKNNMQIMSSLLSLQAAQATERETVSMLNESQSRIRSMALIHETLYRSSSLAEIDFGDYAKGLVDELLRMYNIAPGTVTITVEIENVQLGVDTAIPCALIVNELVSNSLKHAFPDGPTGDVTVTLQRANGAHTLTVADNGVGLPADLDFRATDSLGMQLVTALVNQLDGTITLDRTKGTTFIITFKPDGV